MGKTTRCARCTTRKFVPDPDDRFVEVPQMDTDVQPNPQHENGSKIMESSSDPPGETATNGKDAQKTPPQIIITRETRSRSGTPQQKKDKKARSRSRTPPQKKDKKTRSRSQTPQKKKDKKSEEAPASPLKTIDEYVNGHEEKKTRSAEKKSKEAESNSKNGFSQDEDKKVAKELKKSAKKSKEQEQSSEATMKPTDNNDKGKEIVSVEPAAVSSKDVSKPEGEGVDMDPLVLGGDEPDPELQFDENSDMDSGKGSPIQLRCKTRRSHTRHIPTPKTPKSVTDSESEKNSVAPTPTPENLNDTNDSLNIEDISTKVEVGNDTSRLDFSTSVCSDDNSYLNYSRERSLSETLRGLSSRRSIRPLNDSYRQRAFRNTQNKSDLNLPFFKHESADRVVGLKRKRSTTPEERKRHKSESTGFVSYLSSPLGNLKNRFISDVNSGTPKLTGYKDGSKNIHEEVMYSEVVSEEPEKKNWCSLM